MVLNFQRLPVPSRHPDAPQCTGAPATGRGKGGCEAAEQHCSPRLVTRQTSKGCSAHGTGPATQHQGLISHGQTFWHLGAAGDAAQMEWDASPAPQ